MTQPQLAHLWANNPAHTGRASSLWCRDGIIYSYGEHFPIARHVDGVVLLTTNRRSVTTAKHISFVRRACSHLPVFCVDDVLADPGKKHLADYRQQIKDAVNPGEVYRLEVYRLVTEANRFAETFGFATRFELPADWNERMAAARLAEQRRNATLARRHAVTLARWLKGESVSLPPGLPTVYLRVNGDLLETTKRATVPLTEARRAFEFAAKMRATGWHRNGSTFRVGHFQLDSVDDKEVVAGCHRISWNEIERFAKQEGWI